MSYTLGQPVINLGSYGKLIYPVKVDGGRWFYIWDRTGDGTIGTTGPNFDAVSHDVLDSLFTQSSSGQQRVTSGNTDDTYRFATLNNVRVALPTLGASIDTATPYSVLFGGKFDPGAARYFASTVVGSVDKPSGSDQINGTYDDLLAIWDAFNGVGVSIATNAGAGFPPNWPSNFLWSSTTVVAWDGSVGHVMMGNGGDAYANVDTAQTLVALEVFASTSPTPTYSIASNQLSVNEGSTANFTLKTTNVASGASVPYTLSGISAADVSGGSLSGNAAVNSSGTATISVTLLNDQLTEGSETLIVSAGGSSVSTLVNDTSTTLAPSYSINSNDTVPEYGSIDINVVTTNVPSGTSFSFVISGAGITSSDFDGVISPNGQPLTFSGLNGTTSANSTGVATIRVLVKGDFLTEGDEVFRLSVGNATSIPITIFDRSKTVTPTYGLSSASSSYNEGSSAIFTLTTTNIASGTSVPYNLSGISAADVSGGALSGNAIVNSSGNATISVSLLNDLLTEGSETLTVTAGGATASTVVNDTSKAPTYSIYAGNASYNEGSRAEFTFSATNVSTFTAVTYTISGVSSSDVSHPLSGTIQFSSGPYTYNFYIPLTNDGLTEGDETLTVSIGGVSASAVVKDTSKAAATPSYALTASNSSINEGSIATFTLTTTNVASGTSVPYTLSGISASDVSGGSLSGNAVVNSSGTATISVTLLNDQFTEGSETLTVSAGGASASTVVNDTSISALVDDYPWSTGTTGILNTSGSTLNGNIEINDDYDLFKVNLIAGSRYTIDLVPQSTAGLTDPFLLLYNPSVTFLLDDDNSGGGLNSQISYTALTSGTYYVGVRHSTLTGTGGYKVSVKLASTPTYSLTGATSSVNEGSTATFSLTTTNVASGTSVPYTLSGISASDVSGGSLSGNAIVNSSGTATISVTLLNDSLTEGSETLTVSAGGASASTVVNDTSKAAVVPSYSLSAASFSVNEGSTATFTLTTTNVTAGTSVSYTLSGVSSADLAFGSLSGTTTVASNGLATISVLLANDNLTEGTETLTITAGGASASAQINDTSRSASPTYSISTNWTSTTEGTPIVATLSTTNVAAGTTLYYQLSGSGITSSDFGGLSLSGSSVINSLGQAFLTIPLSADTTTEGDETFVIQYYTDSGRSTAAGSAAFVTILDTSKGAVTPTYAVSSNSSSVNEGSIADFTITTSNVSAGSRIAYTLSGVTSSDITGGALTGFATVNSSLTATVSIPITADTLTEGTETLTISLQGRTASVLINDTSKAAAIPTYNLLASGSTVNEGSVASFSLTTTDVSPGTSVPYTISGVSSTDVTGGLSGTSTVDTNGLATIFVPLAADFLTEGSETLTVTAQGKSASVVVNDTSKTTLVASYALSASTNSVPEGSSAVFTLTTTNVAGGTSIPYTISGVSSSDITGGALSGTAIVSSSGNATITIPIVSDQTTEGTESITVTAQGISSSVLISDTSTTPVVVTPITSVTSIPYGDGKYFYGSSGSDKVTGTSFVDVVKQTSTISSNQLTKLSDGSWQVQNKFTPSNSDNLVNVERVEFSDMSVALDISGPAGQVAKILGSVFGKSYVSNTEFAGIGFAYLDGGMSYLDLCGLAAGAAGLSTPELLVNTLLRNTTGTEPTALSKSSYLQSISSGASYASIVQQIADSSANAQSIKLTDLANTGLAYTPYVLPPTYSMSAASASVNEGSTAVFNLTTTNVAVGIEVSYTLSGISPSDLTSGTLTGKVTIGEGGAASISVPIAADGATEGQETLTVNAQGASASIVVNDTSKGNATPTYSLIAGSSSVDEGASVRVIVNTTNVAPGTSLEYGISGINITTDDLLGGLKGIAVVDSFGMALINLLTLADVTTEGSETMVITMGISNTQIVINDTSVTLVGITDGGGGDGGGGGGGGGSG